MLSPRKLPSAAAGKTVQTLRWSCAASTPAVMTIVSDGTTGKNASSAAIPMMIA
jgi:hypothetical protein